MTDGDENTSAAVDAQRAALAEAFAVDRDPLAAHAATFAAVDADPFALFRTTVLDERDLADDTLAKYERLIADWRQHMTDAGRHPACPNEAHVRAFVAYCRTERGNQPDTVRTKLRRLNQAYEYWQRAPVFPHDTTFNPFTLVLSSLDLSRPPVKEPPRIPIDDLAAVLRTITHVRDRAIIATQLKLGLRATELCNLRLAELHLTDPDLQAGYPDLGTAPALDGRPNAVYVAARDERMGNKSRRPRILPIDDELQAILRDYLLVRPDPDAHEVFLTTSTHNPVDDECVNRIWTDAFRPQYDETPDHRAVTSHFGRHRFTTYWQVEEELPRELVKYMRGDAVDGPIDTREAIDDYLHTYYEDIEAPYRERIFRFDL